MVSRANAERSLVGVSLWHCFTRDLADNTIVVEIELRLPSMLHGKKGFDRIVYAFKNVLNTPATWLFVDLGANSMQLCLRFSLCN